MLIYNIAKNLTCSNNGKRRLRKRKSLPAPNKNERGSNSSRRLKVHFCALSPQFAWIPCRVGTSLPDVTSIEYPKYYHWHFEYRRQVLSFSFTWSCHIYLPTTRIYSFSTILWNTWCRDLIKPYTFSRKGKEAPMRGEEWEKKQKQGTQMFKHHLQFKRVQRLVAPRDPQRHISEFLKRGAYAKNKVMKIVSFRVFIGWIRLWLS